MSESLVSSNEKLRVENYGHGIMHKKSFFFLNLVLGLELV